MGIPRIALCVVTKNEEHKIAKCILSAKELVNEIVIVDSNSKDRTVQICKELGAIVYERAFTGFVEQKNYALEQVTSEWVLFLDPEEVLTSELIQEIKKAIISNEFDGYMLHRVKAFMGKVMHHGGTKSEWVLRLFKTDKANFFEGQFTEKVQLVGKISKLHNVFIHHPYPTMEAYLDRFNRYSSISAKSLFKKGIKFSLLRTLYFLPAEFIKKYFLQLGILDGFRGLVWAVFSSLFVFTRSVKLWSITRQNGKS